MISRWKKEFMGRAPEIFKKGPSDASMNLIDHHLRSTTFHGSPSDCFKAGLLSETNYKLIVDHLEVELDDNATQALAEGGQSSIVQTAEDMGLYPRPNGENPHSWHASCAGTSHPIWIDAEKDIFGCPGVKRRVDRKCLKPLFKSGDPRSDNRTRYFKYELHISFKRNKLLLIL